MKKFIVLAGAALILAGCSPSDNNGSTGGTSDQYGTSAGESTVTNTYQTGTSAITNQDSQSQGAATTPGGENYGSSTNTMNTSSNALPNENTGNGAGNQ